MKYLFDKFYGRRFANVPVLKGDIFLGRLRKMLKKEGLLFNIKDACELALNSKDGICQYNIANQFVLFTINPQHIKPIFVQNYQDENISRRAAFPFFEVQLGKVLFTDVPEDWKPKRKIYDEFILKPDILRKYEKLMQNIINVFLADAVAKKDVELEIYVGKFVLAIMLTSIFNIKNPQEAKQAADELYAFFRDAIYELFSAQNISKFMAPAIVRRILYPQDYADPTRIGRQLRKELLEKFYNPYGKYLLKKGLFVDKLKELIQKDTSDEVLSVVFAGFDTTTTTLHFTIKLLKNNPHVLQKLKQEINHYCPHDQISMDEVKQIKYLDEVIEETLRMFPPIPFLTRGVEKDYEFGPFHMKKGDLIISVQKPFAEMITGLKTAYTPDQYDENHPKPAIIAYGHGPQMCVGVKFAKQTMKLFLVTLLRDYELTIDNNVVDYTLEKGGTLKEKTKSIAHITKTKLANSRTDAELAENY